jgi:hypothetical protein
MQILSFMAKEFWIKRKDKGWPCKMRLGSAKVEIWRGCYVTYVNAGASGA